MALTDLSFVLQEHRRHHLHPVSAPDARAPTYLGSRGPGRNETGQADRQAELTDFPR